MGVRGTLTGLWRSIVGSGTQNPASWFIEWVRGGNETSSGRTIDEQGSLKNSAVWACVDVRSNAIACLPFKLYEKQEDSSRREVTNHPLARMIHDGPDAADDVFQWFEFMQSSLDLWGNAYAFKQYELTGPRAGQITGLVPIYPKLVDVERVRGELWYEVSDTKGRKEYFDQSEIFHIRGKALNSERTKGLSRIAYHRETLGLQEAQLIHGAEFFGNGSVPGGVLKFPGTMTADQKRNKREGWEQLYGSGRGKSHRIGVLDQGMDYMPIAIPNEDSQWLESRKYGVTDVARIFNVPSPLINDLERATFSNVEQLTLQWMLTGVQPMARRWASAFNRQCLTRRQRDLGMYVEAVIEASLWADLESKSAHFRELFGIGVLSQNDIRRLMNMPPIDGGDSYYIPLNMASTETAASAVPAEQPEPEQPTEPEETPEPEPEPQRQAGNTEAARVAIIEAIRERAETVLKIEPSKVGKAASSSDNFVTWGERFYREQQAEKLGEALAPLCAAFGAVVGWKVPVNDIVDRYAANRWSTILDVAGSATRDNLPARLAEVINPQRQAAELVAAITQEA